MFDLLWGSGAIETEATRILVVIIEVVRTGTFENHFDTFNGFEIPQ